MSTWKLLIRFYIDQIKIADQLVPRFSILHSGDVHSFSDIVQCVGWFPTLWKILYTLRTDSLSGSLSKKKRIKAKWNKAILSDINVNVVSEHKRNIDRVVFCKSRLVYGILWTIIYIYISPPRRVVAKKLSRVFSIVNRIHVPAGRMVPWRSARDATYSYRSAHVCVTGNAEEAKSTKGESSGGASIFCP